MLPEDKKWAIGVTVAIAAFFALVILAGRAYLTGIDDSYLLDHTSENLEVKFTLWMLRSDSKDVPIQINPPIVGGPTYAEGKIFIQREYIAESSDVTLQFRTARPILISTQSAPTGARLEFEVFHARIPGHRPVIVVNPYMNATRTTEIYLDQLDIKRLFAQSFPIEANFRKPLFADGYTAKIQQNIYSFTGRDDLWRIEAYDSITNNTEGFNGMALFKVNLRLVVDIGGEEIGTDWMETQYFAVDLVELPG